MSDTQDFSRLCGWIQPEDRDANMNAAHAAALATMPKFAIFGEQKELPDRMLLTNTWKHPKVVEALGFPYPGIHQLTGSCVGAGGGNAIFTLMAAEVILGGEMERITVPLWLLPYGRSRLYAGMRGRGEGSFGSTFARAAREDGVLDAMGDGVPKFENKDGLVWGSSTEMMWSDGASIPEASLNLSRKQVVGTTAQITSQAEGKASLGNIYPMTCAVSHYCDPRNAKLTGGSTPVVLGAFDSRGGHQTTILNYFVHPELGLLFWYQNQWGGVYPMDPITGSNTGCWITAKSFDWACQQEEVFAFSGMKGFEARTAPYIF